jgi:hypothetical protein
MLKFAIKSFIAIWVELYSDGDNRGL